MYYINIPECHNDPDECDINPSVKSTIMLLLLLQVVNIYQYCLVSFQYYNIIFI